MPRGVYEAIKEQLVQSEVVEADETEANVKGKKWLVAHLKMTTNHQLWLAQLLREVIFLSESEAHLFTTDFKAFALSVFTLCNVVR